MKPKDPLKDATISFRCPDLLKRKWQKLAKASKMTLSDYVADRMISQEQK